MEQLGQLFRSKQPEKSLKELQLIQQSRFGGKVRTQFLSVEQGQRCVGVVVANLSLHALSQVSQVVPAIDETSTSHCGTLCKETQVMLGLPHAISSF